jgi:hypothetical protein
MEPTSPLPEVRTMMPHKDVLIRVIEVRAHRRTGELACQLIRGAPEEREHALDEMEFQRWLAESCRDALTNP